MDLYKVNGLFKVTLLVLLLVAVSSCNVNGGGGSENAPEFAVSLTEKVISMSQGDTATLFLEINAPDFVGKTINLELIDLENGTPLTNIQLLPESFILSEPSVRKELKLRLDDAFPVGRYSIQLVVAADNVEARLLLSLMVSPREPLQLSASLRPSAIAVYQGEETKLVLAIETNAETASGQVSIKLSTSIPEVSIDPTNFEFTAGSIELNLAASPNSQPGLYETSMLVNLTSTDQTSEIEIPMSVLVAPNSVEWSNVSSPINEVGACEDNFIAVGDFGALLLSDDGQSWEPYGSPALTYSSTIDDFVDFACGNGKLVIIGEAGQIYVTDLPLSDASSWDVQALAGENGLRQVEFGDGSFVVNAGSSFFISGDAQAWTQLPIDWSSQSIKYLSSNGIWLSAGYDRLDGTVKDVVYRSDDLWQSWTRHVVRSDRYIDISGNILSDGYYALVIGRYQYAYSPDLVNWSARPYPDGVNIGTGCKGVYYKEDGGVWVACGDLFTTRNGRDWERVAVDTPLVNIAYMDNSYTAIAAPRGGRVNISTGGGVWAPTQSRFAPASPVEGWDLPDLRSLASGDGVYVAVGREGTLSVSNDGDIWYAVQILDSENPEQISISWNDVEYSPPLRRFVAVGSASCTGCSVLLEKGYIAWADSYSWNGRGLDWHIIELPDKRLTDITWGSGRYVAVGSSGVVLRSVDGSFWEETYLPDSPYIYDVAANDENVFIASVNGAVYVSTDGGSAWVRREIDGADASAFLCHDGNEFYLFQYSGSFWKSEDGSNWSDPQAILMEDGTKPGGTVQSAYCISGFKLLIISSHSTPALIASIDGTSWRGLLPSLYAEVLYNVNYADNSFFVAGQSATILRTK